MGNICFINRRPNTWPACLSKKVLKPEYGSESLIHIRYGTFDDYPDGAYELEMLMRRSVYNKLLSGEYSVDPDSNRLRRLMVIDRNGRAVEPLGSTIY